MSKQIELEKLDRAIKDSQIRLHTVKSNMDILGREIATLGAVEQELEANVSVLKQEKIIASASEYKKAKEDLKKTKNRLIMARNEREDFKKSMDNVNKVIIDSQQAIDKIKKSGENNVVLGNFGKKENG